MASFQETMMQQAVETPQVSQQFTAGVKDAVGLYEMSEKIKQDKINFEQQMQQINSAKFDKTTNFIEKLVSLPPNRRQAYIKYMNPQLSQMGINWNEMAINDILDQADAGDKAKILTELSLLKDQGVNIDKSAVLKEMQGELYKETGGQWVLSKLDSIRKAYEDSKKLQLEERQVAAQEKIAGARAEASKKTGEDLPLEKKEQIRVLAKDSSEMFKIKSLTEDTIKILRDPKVPEDQKLDMARKSMKLINSDLGQDAIGMEEVKRLGSYINYFPDPFGPKGLKVGPDIESFASSLENNVGKFESTREKMLSEIDSIKGIGQQAPQSQSNTQPQSSQKQYVYNLNDEEKKFIENQTSQLNQQIDMNRSIINSSLSNEKMKKAAAESDLESQEKLKYLFRAQEAKRKNPKVSKMSIEQIIELLKRGDQNLKKTKVANNG